MQRAGFHGCAGRRANTAATHRDLLAEAREGDVELAADQGDAAEAVVGPGLPFVVADLLADSRLDQMRTGQEDRAFPLDDAGQGFGLDFLEDACRLNVAALAVQVYIDDNENEIFEPEDGEESWSEEALDGLAIIDGTADSVVFDEPVDSQGDDPFRLSVSGMSPHVGSAEMPQHLEFMLFDDTDTVVGYHRFPFIISPDIVIDIPGVLESGRTYRAQFYADANRDGEYTIPPGDHAWCLPSQVAGGDIIGLIGAVFVVLLILELVGVTDIFKSF